MNRLSKAYSVIGVLLLVEYLAQFFLAGLMLFTLAKGGENEKMLWAAEQSSEIFFTIHVINGTMLIPITIVLLVVFALLAHYSKRTIILSALLLGLIGLQYLLAEQTFSNPAGSPWLAAFHPLNGLVLLGLTLWLTVRHWAFAVWRRPVAAIAV